MTNVTMSSIQCPPRVHLHHKSASEASIQTTVSESSITTTNSISDPSSPKRSRLSVRKTISSILSWERSPAANEPRSLISRRLKLVTCEADLERMNGSTQTSPNRVNQPTIPSPITVRPLRPDSPSSPCTTPSTNADSKLNSLSTSLTSLSLPSDAESPSTQPTSIVLTVAQHAHIQRLCRRLHRFHHAYDLYSAQLATNVAALLKEQEWVLNQYFGSISGGEIRAARAVLRACKERVGRAFMKKAILGQRATGEMQELETTIQGTTIDVVEEIPACAEWDGKGKGKGRATIPEIPTDNGLRIQLDYQAVMGGLRSLSTGIEAQSLWDGDVLVAVRKAVADERIPSQVADPVTLRRFEGFVKGRTAVLMARADALSEVVKEMRAMAEEETC